MNAAQGRIDDRLTSPGGGTANDRFKSSFGAWLWGGIMLATVLHFAVIEFFPPLTAADLSFGITETQAIDLPPEIEIPPPPEAMARPAVPVVAHTVLEEDITIAPTTFEQNPVETLPPPPMHTSARLEDRPVFTPYTVAPSIKDKARAARIVRDKYPKILQAAGIGGTVVVWAFIDEKGVVKNCQVHTSCGNAALDEAALGAAMEFRFNPALNYDKYVPVWVSIPITFTVLRTS
jgi:protein TonB